MRAQGRRRDLETCGPVPVGYIRDRNGNRVGGYAFDQLADKRPGGDVAVDLMAERLCSAYASKPAAAF